MCCSIAVLFLNEATSSLQEKYMLEEILYFRLHANELLRNTQNFLFSCNILVFTILLRSPLPFFSIDLQAIGSRNGMQMQERLPCDL